MEKKKRTQTIVMIVVAGLLAIASCILLIKLIVAGIHELKRWIFFAVSFAAAVLILSGGIKQLKKDKE